MKITHFPEQNAMYSLPPSPPTPVHIAGDSFGTTTMCWKLSFGERIATLFRGRVWLQIRTMNRGVQPQKLSIFKPEILWSIPQPSPSTPPTTPIPAPGLDALAAHMASAADAQPPTISETPPKPSPDSSSASSLQQ